MNGLARWVRRSRWSRSAAIVLTFLLPLTNIISAAFVIMVARDSGWRSAALDVVASLVLLTGIVLLASGEPGGAAPLSTALGAGALWSGALLSGGLLRRYQSVDLAVQALVLSALAGVGMASLVIADARAHWQPVLETLIRASGLPQISGLSPGWLGTVAALMHGVIGASLLFTLILAMMLALWLDGGPARPEWRRRFLALRLGRVLALVAGIATVLLLAGYLSIGGGAILVLGMGFVAQGLAIVHWTADVRQWPRIWPLALYGPLLLGAPLAGLLLAGLALAGLVDNGFSLRRHRSNVV